MESEPFEEEQAASGRITLADWVKNKGFYHLEEIAKKPGRKWSLSPGFFSLHLFQRHSTLDNARLLPSGLKSGEVSSLVAALVEAFKDRPASAPILASTFLPQNILVGKKPDSKSSWQINWLETSNCDGMELTREETVIAFAQLITQLVYGINPDNQIVKNVPVLQNGEFSKIATVLEKGLQGKYKTIGELSGAFGWSIYQQDNLIFSSPAKQKKGLSINGKEQTRVFTLTPDNPAKRAASARSRFGLTGALSLGLAVILILTFGLISLNDLRRDYTQQEGLTDRTSKALVTATPLATPTSTPGIAVQTSRQANGAIVTRYNPAFNAPSETPYTNPAELTPGGIAPLGTSRTLNVISSQWSSPNKLDLALDDGGWESWNIADKQRISRQELPVADQYLLVSWSPDGQRFAGITIDGQLNFGKGTTTLKTVSYPGNDKSFNWQLFSTSNNVFNWSPDGTLLLVNKPTGGFQLWNLKDFPKQIQPTRSEGSGQESLAETPERESGLANQLIWSADDRFLARTVLTSADKEIWIYNTTNLNRIKVINLEEVYPGGGRGSGSGEVSKTYFDEVGGVNAFSFSWSPDGQYIALLRWTIPNSPTPDQTNPYSPSTVGELTVLESPRLELTSVLNSQYPNPSGPEDPTVPKQVFQTTLSDLSYFYTPISNLQLRWSNDNQLLVVGLKHPASEAVGSAVSLEPAFNDPVYKGAIFDLKELVGKNGAGNNGSGAASAAGQAPPDLPESFKLDNLPPGLPQFIGWSQDSRTLLYNTTRGSLSLLKLSEATEQPQKVTIQTLYAGDTANLTTFLPSPDGKYFIGSRNNQQFSLHRLSDGKELSQVDGPIAISNPYGISPDFLWSPDSQYLVAGFMLIPDMNDNSEEWETIFRAWKVDSNGTLKPLGDLYSTVKGYYGVHFFWDNNTKPGSPALLFNIANNKIARWELTMPVPAWEQQREEISRLTQNERLTNPSPYFKIAYKLPAVADPKLGEIWYPDQKKVAIGSGTSLYLFNVLAADASPELELDQGTAFKPQPPGFQDSDNFFNQNVIALSPDSRVVAAGAPNGLVSLYDGNTGKLFSSFGAHQGMIGTVAFSPDSRFLATVGTDRSIKVWDTKSWRMLSELRGVGAGFSTVQWLPDSQTLAVYNHGYFFWRIPQN